MFPKLIRGFREGCSSGGSTPSSKGPCYLKLDKVTEFARANQASGSGLVHATVPSDCLPFSSFILQVEASSQSISKNVKLQLNLDSSFVQNAWIAD